MTLLEVTHQSLHWGMSETTLLVCLCTKAISEPRSSCHLLERQGWDEIGNVRLNLLSFSFILSLIALLLSPKKMHEKISIAGVCGLGLGLGKASPWGFILTGWTLRPTSLCPGAEGGQESRGVGRFADTPGGEFPFPRFPHFPLPVSAISSTSALCCRADSRVVRSTRDWGPPALWCVGHVRSVCKTKSLVMLYL